MILKRQTLRLFFSQQFAHLDKKTSLSNLGVMALLFKDPLIASFNTFSRINGSNQSRFPQNVKVDAGNDFRINASGEFNLRGCSEHFDEFQRRGDNNKFQKAHAMAMYPQLFRDLNGPRIEDERKDNVFTGNGAVEHGNSLGFSGHTTVPEKLVVAVDVDEVLGNFVSALNKFIADRYSMNHSVSEYHVYEFFKIWNCSRDEADIRVHEFFKTSYFKKGILPIPGSQSALLKLSKFCNLSIVTSRQNVIKDHTIEWIEDHYPGLFQEIHFGNHFALDGKSRPKSDICRSLGARVLIDDNPRYAIECANAGMRVLLFDYENSYPWSKTGSATVHPSVTKVHNWEEVEQQLLSWVMS
ncbi:hypothetical protein IFM89_026108 [Coptis chinensis]|uniref:Tac7077 n=1 Tax=Coptis chinensis TaxID=261450 RepID=A0A835IFM3_9MAGN|nr:hypothetical protein IFM89_026108 [Coptis chinensis]